MDYTDKIWDVVVIGTGMGGAATGSVLAKAGMSVLFLEKGCDTSDTAGVHAGMFAETLWQGMQEPEMTRPLLRQSGRYWQDIEDITSARTQRFIPFIGCGTGGSSRIYGAALERFSQYDFTPGKNFPYAGDADLPDSWPFAYEDLLPFYREAEKIFEVRGTPDSLRKEKDINYLEPSPISDAGMELFHYLQKKGLHPYRLPVGLKPGSPCMGCQSMICSHNCKMDSFTGFIQPALKNHEVEILHDCEVLKLKAGAGRIEAAECLAGRQKVQIRGGIFILAAGALESPRVLLNSCSDEYPTGIGNENDLVGRFLMRHYIDLVAIKPRRTLGMDSHNLKEIGLNDFYFSPEGKLGTFQSFGNFPPAEMIAREALLPLFQKEFPGKWVAIAAAPFLQKIVARMFRDRYFMALIMEDLPYRDNRVTVRPDPENPAGVLQVSYRIAESEKRRIETFRRLIRSVLSGYRYTWLKSAEQNKRIAHAAGTLRAGNEPQSSVVNADCRLHSIENLYVADASVFPSSGGTNPGLTVAANGMRIADRIVAGRNGG